MQGDRTNYIHVKTTPELGCYEVWEGLLKKKNKVFSHRLKIHSEGARQILRGSLFQSWGATAGKGYSRCFLLHCKPQMRDQGPTHIAVK